MTVQNNPAITTQQYNPSLGQFGDVSNLTRGLSTQSLSKDLLYDLYSQGLFPKGKGGRRAVNIVNAVMARISSVIEKMMGGMMEMMQKLLGMISGQQQPTQPDVGCGNNPFPQPGCGNGQNPGMPGFPGFPPGSGIWMPFSQKPEQSAELYGNQGATGSNPQTQTGGFLGQVGDFFKNMFGSIFGGTGDTGFAGSFFGGFGSSFFGGVGKVTNWAGDLFGKAGGFIKGLFS